MRPVRTLARAMLGGLFVIQGSKTFRDPDPLVPRAKLVTDRLAPTIERIHPALPTDARTLIRVNSAVQVGAGLLMVTRLRRPAAALLAGSLAPTTLAGHAFWTQQDPQQRAMHKVQFLKNLSLLGGLLLAAADTEGRPGVRWRTARAVQDANRSLHQANRQVRRGAQQANRSLRRTVRETTGRTRLAVRAANIGRRLPG